MSKAEQSRGKTKQELDRVVFIGRTFEEYAHMFDLKMPELAGKRVLDCPSGACSFTAHGSKQGLDITASDIAYDHKPDDLEAKGLRDIGHAMETMEQAKSNYVWDYYGDVEGLRRHREQALRDCVRDMREFPDRYVAAVLPELPFDNEQFHLVLSAHFLFMYSDRLDYDFHVQTVRELLRVASEEVRIFPLTDLSGSRYVHLDRLIHELEAEGLRVAEVKVPYEFMKNGNSLLSIRKI
ncbi:SAM-dependent methyltransferase [Paenibacillus sp. JNUCC32]|uniref:SAM-dependent methyltransferase n=1 Tax=Paenibacillus sp. JNUCC32 TaxID=2777984 RepID=UPI0017889641|nr:SAM-dependent methyltransferase [Paenibacillus sp. JNUCC-32]QOT09156.1 SAM-dependent methyltransferase [Paenibacillus sp. JNUCC-32]